MSGMDIFLGVDPGFVERMKATSNGRYDPHICFLFLPYGLQIAIFAYTNHQYF
jgi:hypothetical protein